jgi:hypothetical protein
MFRRIAMLAVLLVLIAGVSSAQVSTGTIVGEVSGSAPLVDSLTSSLGQVITNKKIIDLPLNGRNTFAPGLISGNTVPVTGMGTNLPFVAGSGR